MPKPSSSIARVYGSQIPSPNVMQYILGALCALFITTSVQAQPTRSYRILAQSEREVTLEIAPDYTRTEVEEKGHTYQRIDFAGARVDESAPGAPAVPVLSLPFVLPNRKPLSVEVVSATWGALIAMPIAPVPTSIKRDGIVQPLYTVDPAAYNAYRSQLVVTEPVSRFRTAYSQTLLVSPVRFDAARSTIELAEKITIRVRFAGPAPDPVAARALSRAERELFQTTFVNSEQIDWYRSAQAGMMAQTPRDIAAKVAPQHGNTTEWLTIETDQEGVYKITLNDLQAAGITGHPNPYSIELFGYGARPIPEAVTDSSGEWRQCAIEVRVDGKGDLTELYFYAPGVHHWKYQDRPDQLFGLYHTINPYTSAGKYLLKVGGPSATNAAALIQVKADSIVEAARAVSTAFTTSVREVERTFEVLTFSREFVGEQIPRQGLNALTVDLPVDARYVPDSTYMRVGLNTLALKANTVTTSLNGKPWQTLRGGSVYEIVDPPSRAWSEHFPVEASFGTPRQLGLNFQSTEPDSRAWLNWIELFYRVTTDIGSNSLRFYVLDTKEALRYTFTNIAGGGVWDVTNDAAPRALVSNSDATATVEIQGQDAAMRSFVAFSSASALRPAKLSLTTAPKLRSTIGQTGAQNIIIAPEAFLAQARELERLREEGGQATEGMSTEVVLIEDIYKEFGYGVKDPVAIRDFMAYVYRTTMRNGASVPLFLTLFGSGHVDYQNRVTEVPVRIPVWELPHSESVNSMRTYVNKNDPDDGFYARVTPKSGSSSMDPDLGVGRLSVLTVDEAKIVVGKLRTYERNSDPGVWRAVLSFVIDDRIGEYGAKDPLDHLTDAEAAIGRLPSRLQVNKVYGQSYQTSYTSGGRRKPEMEKAIYDAFHDGSAVLSYIGHGNPKVWTHESVFQVPSSINKLSNYNRLSFVTMATCDFAEYDNYADKSGGVLLLVWPKGGAVSLLGTSRSIYGGEQLYTEYFEALTNLPCDAAYGSLNLGSALVLAKRGRTGLNPMYFYILGDPALRLLIPKQYAIIDSINGKEVTASPMDVPALSQLRVSGRVSSTCDSIYSVDTRFNGKATITLYDTRTKVTRITEFPNFEMRDNIIMEGPILYRGTASVVNGRFTASFIVPRDIKFDTATARLSVIAFADDSRSALGDSRSIRLIGADPGQELDDTLGPALDVYIGTRHFKSGDIVPTNSTIIVDVTDMLGLNTSTASIGHSFVAWVDDATSSSVDLAENYTSLQDDYTTGTTTQKMVLPEGRHVLKVRAFDALNNPTFAEVEFIAKDSDPFKIYNASNAPNPVKDHTTFSLMHPAGQGNLVDVELNIYEIHGARVATLTRSDVSENIIEIPWNAVDESGQPVSQGAYSYRVRITNTTTGEETVAFGRFVVVR